VKQVGKGSYGAALLVKLKIDPCVPCAARRADARRIRGAGAGMLARVD
jgi:hypothetical protein